MPQPSADTQFTIPAAYGRACVQCSLSKTKCRFRPGGDLCERCFRGGKECRQAPARRREVKRRGASRTARLEERLDNLVSLLQNQGAQIEPAFTAPTLVVGTSECTTDQDHCEIADVPSPRQSRFPPTPSASSIGHIAHAAPTTDSLPPELDPEDISAEEAEDALQRFQTTQVQYFPFVYIPPTVTAAELRRDKPFLWLCLLAIATRSISKQRLLGAKIRRIIADKLIVESERSLDTLLGLLAYIGWANYHIVPTQPFLSMYCLLVTGLVHDLGLERMPRRADEPQHPMACLKPAHALVVKLASHAIRTMEERRAVIAAYLITSEVSAFRNSCFNRNVDGLRWNSTMDEYLQELDEKREAPFDHILVTLTRLKLVRDEAVRPSWVPLQPSEHLKALHIFQARSLLSRLDDIRWALPDGLAEDKIIRLHILDAEARIHESALYYSKYKGNTAPDPQRLATLAQCIQTVRSWTETYFVFEPAVCASFSFSIWAQLSHVLSAVYRLSLFDEPGWSASVVRETIDLIQVMEELISRFGRVGAEAGLINDGLDSVSPFAHAARSITTIRTAWEPLLRPQTESTDDPENIDVDTTTVDGFSAWFLDGMNEWMSDMMFSWEGS